MTRIAWFRHDLRTIDHPALESATGHGDEVVAICLRTPSTWKRHGWGPRRIQWYDANVRQLSSDLDALGIPLEYIQVEQDEDPARRLAEEAEACGATAIHHGLEAGLDERSLDSRLHSLLDARGIEIHPVTTETVLPVDQIATKTGQPFRVFTPFRKAWDVLLKRTVKSVDPAPGTQTTRLELDMGEPVDGWSPGQAAALTRLGQFLDDGVESYHKRRDRPDLDGTSALSPWLAVGAISPTTCLAPLIQRHGLEPDQWPDGPRTWRDELVWREFYRHVMLYNDGVSMGRPLQAWTEQVPWRGHGDELESWKNGRTGIDIVDAAMNQLVATGWMHNRLRMIVAMFLTKNLLVDWRLGESFFGDQLIDYDFASNNGGWQWSASTGTDAAPYFRVFNPDTQAERIDPDGSFRSRWLGERIPPPPQHDLKSSRTTAIETFRSAREAWNRSTGIEG